jgi:HEAT repeat protein
MPREQLQLLAADVDRLLAAGAAVAAGDEKLRQRSQRLRELGQKVPVLAQIADAVDRAVSAPPKQVAPALLDLLLVVRQVRASLTAAGADGAAEPVPPSGPWACAAPTRDLEGWLDTLVSSGYERPKKLKKAMQQPGFTDLRMVTPLLRALGANHHGLARLVAEKALPAFGRAVLPELERGLDLKGKSGDARRLQAICVLDQEKGAALCRQALAEGSAPVKIQGLKSLSRIAPKETEKAALSLLEQKAAAAVHAAAYYALATGQSDEALEALVSGFLGGKGQDWLLLNNAEHSLAKLSHPRTTARLLEELGRVQEEIRTREAAARSKKKSPAKGGKAKGKAAQDKEAQKAARLLQEAIDRGTRLARLLGQRREKKAVPALVGLLGHSNANLREAAAEALLTLADPEGVRAVADLMDDKQLWYFAIRAAWNLPPKEQFERLQPAVATLSQPKPAQRVRGQNVLNLFSWEMNRLGEPDEAFEDEDEGPGDEEHDEYDDEFEAEDEDGGHEDYDEEGNPRKPITDWDPRWVPALRKHLKGEARDSVAVALTVLEGAKMVPELLKLLPTTAVKGHEGVITALARLQVREAVPKLVELLPQKGVNAHAVCQALRRLGDASLVPTLEAYLKKTKDWYQKHLFESLVEYLEKRQPAEAK